jgi:hypothetical protein
MESFPDLQICIEPFPDLQIRMNPFPDLQIRIEPFPDFPIRIEPLPNLSPPNPNFAFSSLVGPYTGCESSSGGGKLLSLSSDMGVALLDTSIGFRVDFMLGGNWGFSSSSSSASSEESTRIGSFWMAGGDRSSEMFRRGFRCSSRSNSI